MQETAVARKLTVEENIELYSELSGQPKDEISEIKKYIYESFGLEKVKKQTGIKTIRWMAEKTVHRISSRSQT